MSRSPSSSAARSRSPRTARCAADCGHRLRGAAGKSSLNPCPQTNLVHYKHYTHKITYKKIKQAKTPAPAKLKEFKAYLAGEGASRADIKALRDEVEALAASFPMPGL